MKKFVFFAAVAIAVSFASCNCNNKSAATETDAAPAVEAVEQPVVEEQPAVEPAAGDSIVTEQNNAQ